MIKLLLQTIIPFIPCLLFDQSNDIELDNGIIGIVFHDNYEPNFKLENEGRFTPTKDDILFVESILGSFICNKKN